MVTDAKIIIVDDEAAIRHFLHRTLTREGYQVTAVESGAQALQEIAKQEFDLALIDLRLKDMDGLELLADMRAQYPATTVIILTAHASLESAVVALRQGAHDYLFKPCATVNLHESVRSGLLRREQELQRREMLEAQQAPSQAGVSTPPSMPRTFLQFQGLIVDPVQHIITLDGHLLELSPTEFDLLAYLVNEAPRVVSAAELIREVQGYETDTWVARDTVRSHVYHIRQKAKSAAGRTIIRTVRGVGYTVA